MQNANTLTQWGLFPELSNVMRLLNSNKNFGRGGGERGKSFTKHVKQQMHDAICLLVNILHASNYFVAQL